MLALSVMTTVMAGAVVLIRRARGTPGWQIWEHLLAAFALVVAVAVFLGQEVFFGSGKYLGGSFVPPCRTRWPLCTT